MASTGWGSSGPYLTRPGQDLLAQAVSGTSFLAGEEGGPPDAAAVGVADFTAGFHIVIAALAGVFRKTNRDQGQRIDVDLLSSMMHLYIQEYAVYLNGGGEPVRSSSGIPNAYLGAPYGYFETADGYIAIPMNPINKVAELIGVEGYEDVTETQVMENRDAIRTDLAKGFLAKTTDEWLEILLAEDIWCAKVQNFSGAEHDPQIAENQMIVEWEHPEAGTVRTTGVPFRLTETPGGVFRPAPLLGGAHRSDSFRSCRIRKDRNRAAARCGGGCLMTTPLFAKPAGNAQPPGVRRSRHTGIDGQGRRPHRHGWFPLFATANRDVRGHRQTRGERPALHRLGWQPGTRGAARRRVYRQTRTLLQQSGCLRAGASISGRS